MPPLEVGDLHASWYFGIEPWNITLFDSEMRDKIVIIT